MNGKEYILWIHETYMTTEKNTLWKLKVSADKLDDAFYEANKIINTINETYLEIYIDSINPWDN